MLVRQNKNITAQGELEGAILIVSWNTISRGDLHNISKKLRRYSYVYTKRSLSETFAAPCMPFEKKN